MNEPFQPPMPDPRARDQQSQSRPPHPHEHQPHEHQPYGYPPYRGHEPLAHEGGFAYGNPPAPPASYGHPDQFVPAHLQVPHPYAQPMYQQPYLYPPQMQQTVFVNGGNSRRVNHALHLVLTLLTAGLWLPVWIILAIANS